MKKIIILLCIFLLSSCESLENNNVTICENGDRGDNCELIASEDKGVSEEIVIENKKVSIGKSEDYFIGKDLEEVANFFENKEFKNIEKNSVEVDLSTENLSGKVKSITIDGNNKFTDSDSFSLDSKIIIEFYKEKETESISSDFNIVEDKLFFKEKEYKIIEVEGGDRNGTREKNVAVDIGFGKREYYGLTNEFGQLVYVLAENIVLQDEENEEVTSDGRYYHDEANVPGTEHKDLDQGHVIADSLGGVANAYNITPQDSTLNRHGLQAYMERVIREANGCTNFFATITYPNTKTQIPSNYHYEYILKGNKIVDDFDNVNPDNFNEENGVYDEDATLDVKEELDRIDTNKDGKVTITEAEAAGYKMPIYSSHWLYEYMNDRDGDGIVG